MKIGIITYVKCDNYGAELQACALQWKLNQLGYDAEVIDLEKREKDLSKNASSIIPAIKNRVALYGFLKGTLSIFSLAIDVIKRKISHKNNRTNSQKKHEIFIDFFENKIKHSNKRFTLEEIRTVESMPYDALIAGSDQIWNYMHTDFLDVYFLEFAKKFNARRISYAASISAKKIPDSIKPLYKSLIPNIEYISVRETYGAEIIKEITGRDAEVVLDPTLLISADEWDNEISKKILDDEKYLLVYTLSGSRRIDKLCHNIAKRLGCKIVYVRGDFRHTGSSDSINLYDVGPGEWVGLISGAEYVVTDSFHGTAFSINFNKPFTTLVNPVSNMNSRVLSLLEITGLNNRIIYDNEKNVFPETLTINYAEVNQTIGEWRKKSLSFINNALIN